MVGPGRAAHDRVVACDGVEGKQRGRAACEGAGGKGSGGRMRRGQQPIEPAPSMWVGTCGSGLGVRGRG